VFTEGTNSRKGFEYLTDPVASLVVMARWARTHDNIAQGIGFDALAGIIKIKTRVVQDFLPSL
jgi:hypothetical protein